MYLIVLFNKVMLLCLTHLNYFVTYCKKNYF